MKTWTRIILAVVLLWVVFMMIVALTAAWPAKQAHAQDERPRYYENFLPRVNNWRPTPVISVYFDNTTGMIDIDVIGQDCRYIDVSEDFLYSVSRACSYLGWMYYPSNIEQIVINVHYPERVVPVIIQGPWSYGD